MKLAIVIPWFGRDLKGGAEQQAWQVATRLAKRGHSVEVLTTCCRSHQDDWSSNHLPAGESETPEGFTIRRFPVVLRYRGAFDAVCSNLLRQPPDALKPGVSPVTDEEAQTFVDELIRSPALQTFLQQKRLAYDAFLFLPYLYGPIIHGVAAVGDRAVLQPCLHDEAYAYLPQIADSFYQANRLFFNSEGEQELAVRLFGPCIPAKSHIIGEGVEVTDRATQAGHSRNGSPTETGNGRYLLYLGRKDDGKNIPLLLRAFARFRTVRPNSSLRLILAGAGEASVPLPAQSVDSGLVSEKEKEELLRHCAALVQPSEKESFSRVMMEAWLYGKPVAVHRRCAATAIPVKAAKGGWLADSEDQWASLFVELDRTADPAMRQLGENGRRYAAVAADWEVVMDRYEAALVLSEPKSPPRAGAAPSPRVSINQFLPNLSYGDAISNHAIWIRDQLRAAGYDSRIYVQYIDPQVADQCELFTVEKVQRSDAAIYHHSIGTEITPHLIEFSGPKCLIYHNITPGEFFEAYRPEFAQILYKGRHDLQQLGQHFKLSVGDSAFNADELARDRFPKPGVLPLAIDPCKWAFRPDPAIMNQLQDGRTNILFVGRFAPNKKQDDLIVAFSHYLQLDPGARLILVGKPEFADPYVIHLGDLVGHLGLTDSVLLPGSIADAQLAAYYRSAHLFWSMSEHEGFCVPLIESMWFDVPIIAFKSSAVPETLAEAGLMFTDKKDMPGLAALAHLVVTDPELREKLVLAQRKRRLEFLPEKVSPVLMEMVGRLFSSGKMTQGRPRRGAKSNSTNTRPVKARARRA
ncbi:MAG TPA: glycosyltransferase [Chthoniobacterales bacterium]|nr:glycosyltransferase [Chthoniobacterales bacterium]